MFLMTLLSLSVSNAASSTKVESVLQLSVFVI
jgi:hypothetical protein